MPCGKDGKRDSDTEWRIYYPDSVLPSSSLRQQILHIRSGWRFMVFFITTASLRHRSGWYLTVRRHSTLLADNWQLTANSSFTIWVITAIKYPQPRCVCYRPHGNRWRWIGKKGANLICYGRLTVCFPEKKDFYLSFLYFINRWVEIKCNNEMSCTNWHTKTTDSQLFRTASGFCVFSDIEV